MEYYVHLLHLHWRQLAEHKVMPNSLFCVMKHSWMVYCYYFCRAVKFSIEVWIWTTSVRHRFSCVYKLTFTCADRPGWTMHPALCISFFFSLSVLKKAHVHSANLSSNLLISNQTEMSSPFISPAWHCFHSKQFPFPCTNRRALHLDLMSFKVSTVVNAWLMGEDCL